MYPPTNESYYQNLQFNKIALAIAIGLALQGDFAVAETITVGKDQTYTNNIETTAGDTVSISGTVDNEKFLVNGSELTIGEDSVIETGVLDLRVANPNGVAFQSESISASKYFVYRGGPGNNLEVSLTSQVKTPWLALVGTTSQTGFKINNQEVIAGVQNFWIESHNVRTRIVVDGDLDFTDKPVYLSQSTGQDAGVEIKNAGTLVKFSDVHVIKGKGLIQINNNGAASVENLHLAADTIFNFQTLKDANTWEGEGEPSASFSLANATIEENGSLRLSVYGNNSAATISGDAETGAMTLNLAKGAGVDFGGWHEAEDRDPDWHWRPENITVTASQITINIADSSSSNYVYLSKPGLETKASNIHVVAAASNNTGNAAADLEKLVDIVQTNYKDEVLNNHLECLPGIQLEQTASDIYDGAVGVVGDGIIDPNTGDCIGCGITNMRTIDNPNVHGIAEMTALGLHIWRNEIDDMHRRMGELRDSSAQANGLWTRIYNGKASFGGQKIENKYTAFQFGYDHLVSPGLWVGGALSYTYGDNTFGHGGGDSNLLAFTGYASRLFDNGIYLDFTGKIGRMKNSFDISLPGVRSSGDYHTNAVSVSVEAGWRFYPIENVFIEPQLEIWYGHVFDADYTTSTDVNVNQTSTDSLVGRAGFRLGIKCPDNRGSAFIKASVLHDWEGEADFRFSKGTEVSRTITEDLGGTWYEYGIGADFNATEQLHFWAELERGDGGDVDTDYRATIGMRYAW